MVLNQLKQIRNELKNSAELYDNAFKNTAIIAATELSDRDNRSSNGDRQTSLDSDRYLLNSSTLNSVLDKKYFVDKYGTLKDAKSAYQKIYGKQKFGRSWSDFIAVVKTLDSTRTETLTLEARITKIEKFLQTFGYQS